MKVKLLIVLCLSLSLALLSNCKKDPQPADPCAGKQLPKADFILAEKLVWEDRYFETDKMNYGNTVFLRGPEGYKTYLWQVGTNMNWSSQKNATVSFSQAEGKLKVRLIATREPMSDCFAGDDGVDTIEKFIDIVENIIDNRLVSSLQGEWEGKSTQYGDSIYSIVLASKDSLSSSLGKWRNYLFNITNSCSCDGRPMSGYIMWSGQAAYTRKTDTGRCVFKYIAYTFPQNKDSIVVEYAVEGPAPDYKYIPYTFVGKRK